MAAGGEAANPAKAGWANVPKDIASTPANLRRMFTVDRNAVLVNRIDSELPGKVGAQVETDAYASHGAVAKP